MTSLFGRFCVSPNARALQSGLNRPKGLADLASIIDDVKQKAAASRTFLVSPLLGFGIAAIVHTYEPDSGPLPYDLTDFSCHENIFADRGTRVAHENSYSAVLVEFRGLNADRGSVSTANAVRRRAESVRTLLLSSTGPNWTRHPIATLSGAYMRSCSRRHSSISKCVCQLGAQSAHTAFREEPVSPCESRLAC